MFVRRGFAALLLPVCLAGVTGCGSVGSAPPGTVSVVATTDVYGDIVKTIAGNLAGTKVLVTSIINNATADPHSFEGNARTLLAFARANVVIENGGGFDDFAERMRSSAGNHPVVVTAVDIAHTGQDNEHVWFDFAAMAKLAKRIAAVLANRDHNDADTFAANANRFDAQLRILQEREKALAARYGGTGVAITEPLPLYLLHACGLVNRTPAAFSAAVETGNDVSPAILQQTLNLFDRHSVRALVYNRQTIGAEVQRVIDASNEHRIPTVAVSETLPAHTNYVAWMRSTLDALASALKAGQAS